MTVCLVSQTACAAAALLLAVGQAFAATPEEEFAALYLEAFERRLEELGPEDERSIVALRDYAALLLAQDRPSEAEPRLRVLVELAPTAQHLALLAETRAAEGDSEETEALLRRALHLEREPNTILRLASLLEGEARWNEAEKLYEEATNAQAEPAALVRLAALREARGVPDEAETTYRRALALQLSARSVNLHG